MKTFKQFIEESVEVNEVSKALARRYLAKSEQDVRKTLAAPIYGGKVDHSKIVRRGKGDKMAKKVVYRDEHPEQQRYDSLGYKGD